MNKSQYLIHLMDEVEVPATQAAEQEKMQARIAAKRAPKQKQVVVHKQAPVQRPQQQRQVH